MVNIKRDEIKQHENYVYLRTETDLYIIDFEQLGEIYQQETNALNLEAFKQDTDEAIIKAFEGYKEDCIHYGSVEEWANFEVYILMSTGLHAGGQINDIANAIDSMEG